MDLNSIIVREGAIATINACLAARVFDATDEIRARTSCAACGAQGNMGVEDPSSALDGPSVSLKACSGCQYARYCGPACQRAAWPLHRHACAVLRSDKQARGGPFKGFTAGAPLWDVARIREAFSSAANANDFMAACAHLHASAFALPASGGADRSHDRAFNTFVASALREPGSVIPPLVRPPAFVSLPPPWRILVPGQSCLTVNPPPP